VLILRYGLIGAAVAAVVAAALALTASIVATRRFFRFDIPFMRFGGIALAAMAAGAVLWAMRMLAVAHGPLAELLAGGVGFALAYAAGLALQGLSLRALLKTPWAPLGVQPAIDPASAR